MTARIGFSLDLGRCVGCGACVLACRIENDVPDGLAWRRVLSVNPGRAPEAPAYHFSLACHHCQDPPCEQACPTGALEKRSDGVVLLHTDRCVGCRYCEMACPFDAPAYDPGAGLMTKCHLCHPRLDQRLSPACVTACPTGALHVRRDLGREDSAGIPGFADPGGAGPALRLSPPGGRLRAERMAELKSSLAREDLPPPEPVCAGGEGFHELPLVVFTALAAAGGGVGGGHLLLSLLGGSLVVPGRGLLGAAATLLLVGLLFSLGHLGRPWRAALALRRPGRSPLSREVVVVGLAFASGALGALLPHGTAIQEGAALVFLAAGALTPLALGLVYRLPGQLSWAGTAFLQPLVLGTLFGLVLLFLAGGSSGPATLRTGAGLTLLADAVLLLSAFGRARRARSLGSPHHPGIWRYRGLLFAARGALGVLLPVVFLLADAPAGAVASVALALLADRFLFYGLSVRRSTRSEIGRAEAALRRGNGARPPFAAFR